MRQSEYIPYCGECPYAKNEDASGYMWCELMNDNTHCSNQCNLSYGALTPKRIAKILHNLQKWRRGGKGKMPNPYIIGVAIDSAIRILRKGKDNGK